MAATPDPGVSSRADSERWARLVRSPSPHIYEALRCQIDEATPKWLASFVQFGGANSLAKTVAKLAQPGPDDGGFADAILLLDCLGCLRSLLSTRPAMEHVAKSPDIVVNVVKGLLTHSPLAKKHLCEILTAVCVYSVQGYTSVLDAFNQNKSEWVHPSRFSVLVAELDAADTSGYRVVLMGLVNSIINCTPDVKIRNSLRNEFISVQLLDVLHQLGRDGKDAQLAVQIQLFIDQRHADDKFLSRSLDVNSHRDLFNHVYEQVLGVPESMDFLSLLQDLAWMYNSQLQSPCKWQLICDLVHQVTCLATENDVDEFSSSVKQLLAEGKRKKASGQKVDVEEFDLTLSDAVIAGAPGTQKLDRMDSGIDLYSNSSAQEEGGFQRQGSRTRSGRRICPALQAVEETEEKGVPTIQKGPTQQLKWVKVPTHMANRPSSVWGQNVHHPVRLDFHALEEEFSRQVSIDDHDDEVELLGHDLSLTLNLFLGRLEASSEELVDAIIDGDESLSVSTLRYLHSSLPSPIELEQLKCYTGERFDLGPAEQFLLQLSEVPHSQTRIEAMLFRAEYIAKSERLKSSLRVLCDICRNILHHSGLKTFLRLVLKAGNFLNTKSAFANAKGFTLSSLERLKEVKGRNPWNDLLGHLVNVTAIEDEEVLLFVNDFIGLDKAASLSLDLVKSDVNALNEQFQKLQLSLEQTEPKVKAIFEMFMEDAKTGIKGLLDMLSQATSYRHHMAVYFCEDDATFDLQTCLGHISVLSHSIKHIRKERAELAEQFEMATAQRAKLVKQISDKHLVDAFGNNAVACSSFVAPHTDHLVDDLLTQVQSGSIRASDLNSSAPSSDSEALLLSHIAPIVSTPARPTAPHFGAIPVVSMETLDDATMETTLTLMGGKIDPTKRSQVYSVKNCSTVDDIALLEKLGVKIHKKVPLEGGGGKVVKGHRRSNSELNESVSAAEKWQVYLAKTGSVRAKEVTRESGCVLASLGLEQKGLALSREDIHQIQRQTDKGDDAPKKKKRSSLGFLRKFGRAVLGSRSPEENIQKSGSDDHGDKHEPEVNEKPKIGLRLYSSGGKGRQKLPKRPSSTAQNKENADCSVYENARVS